MTRILPKHRIGRKKLGIRVGDISHAELTLFDDIAPAKKFFSVTRSIERFCHNMRDFVRGARSSSTICQDGQVGTVNYGFTNNDATLFNEYGRGERLLGTRFLYERPCGMRLYGTYRCRNMNNYILTIQTKVK